MKKSNYLLIFVFVVCATIFFLAHSQNKSELSLKYQCSEMIDLEKLRFSKDDDLSLSSLWGVFYSEKLNSCVSKWALWAGDIGTLKFGYFDIKNNNLLKEIIEYQETGGPQFPDSDATEQKAKEYESEIGLWVNSAFGRPFSAEQSEEDICKFSIDQATKNRVDDVKNSYYYDTLEDVYYSKWLNTCLSKWKRYWVNDLTLQILYYDALSGQSLNDSNLPEAIQQFKRMTPEALEEKLELEKI